MAKLSVEPRLCRLWFPHSPCGPQTLTTSPQWCRTPAWPCPQLLAAAKLLRVERALFQVTGAPLLWMQMPPGWGPGRPGNCPAPTLRLWGWGGKFKALEAMGRWRQIEAGWFSEGLQSWPAARSPPESRHSRPLPFSGPPLPSSKLHREGPGMLSQEERKSLKVAGGRSSPNLSGTVHSRVRK